MVFLSLFISFSSAGKDEGRIEKLKTMTNTSLLVENHTVTDFVLFHIPVDGVFENGSRAFELWVVEIAVKTNIQNDQLGEL